MDTHPHPHPAHPRRRPDHGFSMIELLVVVIVIGILAAIAIPTFMNQRRNGWRSAAESDARNAAAQLASYAANHNGMFPADGDVPDQTAAEAGQPVDIAGYGAAEDLQVSEQVYLVYTPQAGGSAFCLEAYHAALVGGGDAGPHAAFSTLAGGLMIGPTPGCV